MIIVILQFWMNNMVFEQKQFQKTAGLFQKQ